MPLYRERKRLQDLADREAGGEYVFTDWFSSAARIKVVQAFGLASHAVGAQAWNAALNIVLHDEGRERVTAGYHSDARSELAQYLTAEADTDGIATVIEAMDRAAQITYDRGKMVELDVFRTMINEILASYRITFELINGEMVPYESRELHQEIVAPILRLLGGLEGWDGVEDDYQEALKEIAVDPGDAITDAGRALQTTLELLGCQGNKLGPLIASAKEKGLLAPHDTGLGEGIRKIMDWVSADRSNMGDAHTQAKPTPDDAWLAVHVVGR